MPFNNPEHRPDVTPELDTREAGAANSPLTSKRLLLVSYHYPPSEATGALRWQRLTALAAKHGWGADPVCLDASQAGRTDPRRLADLPPGTGIHGVTRSIRFVERLEQVLLRMVRVFRRWRGGREGPGVESPATATAAASIDERSWFGGGV